MTLSMLAAIFWLGAILWTVWILICNERTGRERQAIIAVIFADDVHWRALLADYDAVTYDRHLYRRAFLIDPMPFYGAAIQAALRKGHRHAIDA